VSLLRGWLPAPPDGPWWMQGDAWRVAIDTGFARPTGVQVAPDLIFCHRGRFLAIDLLEPGQEISPAQEVTGGAIWAAGGISAACRSVEDVAAVLEAFGCRSHAAIDHRIKAAALYVQ
jgi:hypothetical protein